MSEIPALLRRVIARAGVLDVPDGLVALPTSRGDVEDVTALRRATDIAGCGHTSSNLEETRAWLSHPGTDWEYGAITLRRGKAVVGALAIRDGLKSGQGWSIDVFAEPGDVRRHAIHGALIDAALREGRYRWDVLYMDPDEPLPVARAACYANDAPLLSDLGERGFVEVGRFRRVKVDHWSIEGLTNAGDAPAEAGRSGGGDSGLPPGSLIRPFADTESDWRAIHRVAAAVASADRDEARSLDFDTWRSYRRVETEDTSQWLLAETEGGIVGVAMGSNRYASEDYGYVANLAVLPEHRGHGLGRALLRARIDDDIDRGFLSTIMHVDAADMAGAQLSASLGMVPDSDFATVERGLFRDA